MNATARDRYDRSVRDLRISVTDRCNFRCRYCMPRESFGPDHAFLERDELLSFAEITRVARLFAEVGVSKIRLTGGEPLLRQGLPDLVARLAEIDGVDDLALTTNGSLLPSVAPALRAAGLDRVTVSLDSLDDATFRAVADVALPLSQVLDGVDAAVQAGFPTVKLNTVLRRGLNDHEVLDLAGYARARGLVIRFIEYMDVGATNGWMLDEVVPGAEVVATIGERWPLEPVPPRYDGEVANRWRYRDGSGEVGVVASVTQPFCGSCTRARLSAVGEVYTCLFASQGRDLRGPLRAGLDDDAVRDVVLGTWAARTDRYSELRGRATASRDKVEMSYIGG